MPCPDGHPTSDHPVVSEEGRVDDTALGRSIHNEHPTELIDMSECSHIVGLTAQRVASTCL